MSKKRKKQVPKRITTPPKKGHSKADIEQSYVVAKKMLKYFNLDPNLIDGFVNKQKEFLLSNIFEVPNIKAEKERTVPRQYIKAVRTEIHNYMKTQYLGDPEDNFNYMELITYGLGFYMSIISCYEKGLFINTAQGEIMKIIYDKFKTSEHINECLNPPFRYMKTITVSFSQINFRLYGFNYSLDPGIPRIKGPQFQLLITARDCESKSFTYHNAERKAFRLITSDDYIKIPRKKIFPSAKENEFLNVYIQSHALHRFKERIDVFDTIFRNYIYQFSLAEKQIVVETAERQKLLACLLRNRPVGYFTFFTDGDDLVVNTFIPLISENTPEGQKLHQLLSISKEDSIYLGMDKISFFAKVDFEQIPILKQALIDSNIWETKIELDNKLAEPYDENSTYKPEDFPEEEIIKIDMNKTLFVKKFFDKSEQYRIDMLS